MNKFKKSLVFNPGEKLKTRKGILTDWTFISESHMNATTGKRYIVVKCKCDKEKTVCLNNIRNGNSICCGLSPCRGVEREKDPEVGHKAIMYVYKKHAKERGFEFSLTYTEFKKIISMNCHYCQTAPSQVYQLKHPGTNKIRSGVPVSYNGIDRVNSKGDYTLDNVVPCCKICNRAKSDLSLDDFKSWIIKLTKFIEYGTSYPACQI